MGMDKLEIHWFESFPPNFASSGSGISPKLALFGFVWLCFFMPKTVKKQQKLHKPLPLLI